ncbi:MAG: FtsQ-type POTRA domain-containing protein [Myxococcales bacterium]|nr:MAG: FtsQ-type POTRA domain-containing protein [Myxococcales bacterium]
MSRDLRGRRVRANVKRSEASPPYGRMALGFAKFVGVYLLFVGVFLVWREAYFFAVERHWFDVREIDIVGASRIPEPEIVAYSGLKTGVPIFSVDIKRAALQVEAHPWIKRARLSRRLPDGLYLEVSEYVPVGLLRLERLYYIDAEGVPFTVADPPPEGFVVIEGMSGQDFENLEAGARKVRRALELIDAYRAHPMADLARLVYVRFHHNLFELVVGEAKTNLVIGKSNRKDALDRAAKLWRRLEAEGKIPQEIHLDNRNQPERVSVRFAAAPQASPDGKTETGTEGAEGTERR